MYTYTFEDFSRDVRRLTELTIQRYPILIENYPLLERRGRGYEVDHKVSIHDAWLRRWTPEQTADPSNLRVITQSQNRAKGINSLLSR